MKKALFLPLLLSTLTLFACGENTSIESQTESPQESSSEASWNREEVNKLKDLLSKQDLSPIYTKMFVSMFTQDYDFMLSHNGGQDDMETSFYSYRGGGAFGCLYEVSEASYAEVEALQSRNFFDYLARGKGSYGMVQTATLVSYLYENNEYENVKSLQGLTFSQQVEARFSEDNVQVCNSLFAKDSVEGGYDVDTRQYFNGIIDKGTLFDAITVRAFSDIFASTNLFDGQRSCETLDRIYFETVKELCDKTDAELGAFIAHNDIEIEEGEDTTLVHFKVGDESLRAVLEENDIAPGAFEGTLIYEKESGKFASYEYKISHVVNETDLDEGTVQAVSMEFQASGYSWNQRYDEDLYIDPDPTVYEDADEFLDDVVREVIPPAL